MITITPAQDEHTTDDFSEEAATSSNLSATVTPDEETKLRIKYLANVGKALFTLNSEVNQQTDFYVAKESLNKFKQGILKLQLEDESRKGMLNLIEYLQKKIDRRLKASR